MDYQDRLTLSCRPLAFTPYKAFLKSKKNSRTSVPTSLYHYHYSRAHSLVVSNLRSETNCSRFESGYYLCAEVSFLQYLLNWCLSVCESSGRDSKELKKCPPPSPAVLWFVNPCERKRRQKKKCAWFEEKYLSSSVTFPYFCAISL